MQDLRLITAGRVFPAKEKLKTAAVIPGRPPDLRRQRHSGQSVKNKTKEHSPSRAIFAAFSDGTESELYFDSLNSQNLKFCCNQKTVLTGCGHFPMKVTLVLTNCCSITENMGLVGPTTINAVVQPRCWIRIMKRAEKLKLLKLLKLLKVLKASLRAAARLKAESENHDALKFEKSKKMKKSSQQF